MDNGKVRPVIYLIYASKLVLYYSLRIYRDHVVTCWNAVGSASTHSELACSAALELKNLSFKQDLAIRVGIATGDALVGYHVYPLNNH